MFALTDQPIDPAVLRAQLAQPEAGALTVFEGRVRNHHLGQAVTRLEYEAFDELARHEGEALVAETERLYPGSRVVCVHRTGALVIGDVAVWIGVASAHRAAGFAACRHLIEEIKRRLPVWKKEHHPDGAAEWVNCSTEAATAPGLPDYHARQVALPEVGAAGQAKLAAARVLVVGVGGLGCPAALALAGAGLGRLTLVDGGVVELANLHRQTLFTPAEVGAPKALAAAARLRVHNPDIEIVAHDGALTGANAAALVAGHTVALDCTDNFPARFILHDACRAAGVPLVSAAVHRFEGELNVFAPAGQGCLHCLWPGQGAEALEAAGNCAGGPVFGPAVGVLGLLQAAEAIKWFLGLDAKAARQTRLVDLLGGTQFNVERTARADCPVCGTRPASAPAAGPRGAGGPLFLTAADVTALGAGAQSIYLTEAGEPAPAGRTSVPALDLPRLRQLAAAGPLVLSCRHGLRSAAIARLLRTEGFEQAYVLTRR